MHEFMAACSEGDVKKIDELLTTQVEPIVLQRGLSKAIEAGRLGVVDKLLRFGVPIGPMIFDSATCAESQEVWECLLEHGWDLNDTKYYGSALSLSTGQPSLVKWMLEHGADPDLKFRSERGSFYQSSALKVALAGDDIGSIRLLVAYGATLDSELLEKCLAFVNQDTISIETMRYLLDAGIDTNAVIDAGRGTPLQLAVRRGMTEKAELLLQAGARTDVRNEQGLSLVEEARLHGDTAMIELLSRHTT